MIVLSYLPPPLPENQTTARVILSQMEVCLTHIRVETTEEVVERERQNDAHLSRFQKRATAFMRSKEGTKTIDHVI
jgi:hypothetical protein